VSILTVPFDDKNVVFEPDSGPEFHMTHDSVLIDYLSI